MKTIKRTFYRPHKRVQEDGAMINRLGEVSYPPSMTKQEFKREADINNILKQYSATGMLSHVSARAATGAYIDLPDSVDFQESLNTVKAAETAFASLPSKIRDRFHNDPAEFLAFCSDAANLDELRKLGLAKPEEPVPPAPSDKAAEPPPNQNGP